MPNSVREAMSPEHRREVFERIVARIESNGLDFERHPIFLVTVDDWINGTIDMQQLLDTYTSCVRYRLQDPGSGETSSVKLAKW